ncbi:LPS export ABC transporter permease LptG [uncultured Moraxella sp.]|uniref:LPS export ABC transporter permease LptG n=1 Tax=uncultured Moraxella sp. TaxID=263769 RepID=UPI0025D53BA3|nr:LPS export ABC transporter permease LptG [uncultured Moraxella sp.]
MKSWLLPRYVIRSAFLAMAGAVLGLWLLQGLFAYLAELQDINDTYTLGDALRYIVYRSPYFLVQFMPTGTLLGAVIGLGLLANHSELIVMRAAGLSLYRIIGWVMIPATLFVMLSLGVNQFILPSANYQASAIKYDTKRDKLITINGYWSVSNHDNTQDVVYINYADSDGKLGGVKRYQLIDGNLSAVTQAQDGIYQPQNTQGGRYTWQLNNINQLSITPQGVKREVVPHERLSLPLAPADIYLLTREPEELSLTDLYAHRQLMNAQATRSLKHEVAFWQKLFSPFSVLSLVLVASSFVFGSLRSQGLGLRIVLALLTGLLFSYLTDLVGFVALATGLSPMLMAIVPIVLSTLAGMYLLNKKSN